MLATAGAGSLVGETTKYIATANGTAIASMARAILEVENFIVLTDKDNGELALHTLLLLCSAQL